MVWDTVGVHAADDADDAGYDVTDTLACFKTNSASPVPPGPKLVEFKYASVKLIVWPTCAVAGLPPAKLLG